MEIFAVSDRIKKIRAQYLQTPTQQRKELPYSYGNHSLTLHWLEGFLAAREAETNIKRRSLAQKYELEHSKVIIHDHELLVGEPDFYLNDDERCRFNKLYEMFKMSARVQDDSRSDHTALDYRKLLELGVEGLLDQIRTAKEKLTFTKESISEDIEKEDFYDSCIIELEALIVYAQHYEQALRECAEKAESPRREELLIMADNMSVVPRYPAKTFWQALQSIHFYTFTLRGLYSAGRPDQDLLKYYEHDLACGLITREFAQELIDNYCLTFASYIAGCTAVGLMVGGSDEEGNLVENDLTWMFLTAISHINMPDPNTGLCVNSRTSVALIKYALHLLGQGYAYPAFWNDDSIVSALIQRGYDKKDAHRYINSTCVELTVIGKSASWTTCPYHNLAQILLDTLNAGDYVDFNSLKDGFFRNIKHNIAFENHRINHLKLERSRNGSEPLLHSVLVDDCIARGRSVGQNGAIYNQTMPNFLGFANAIDSLSAIRTIVYERKELSLSEYKTALVRNYVGYENLRQQILRNTEHYGNAIERVDALACELAACIQDGCNGLITLEGASLIPGIFSYNYHVYYGRTTPATPDGRLDGEALSDSAGPAQGRDTVSPTAAILSGTCWGQCGFTGGVAQNIKLTKHFFEDHAVDSLVALLRTFFQYDGCELQINTVNREILEDARRNPDAHRDLIVRVGGYSDFFTLLSAQLQQEIIDRTEY